MSPVNALLPKAVIREILACPLNREWSIQGLGMLRTYLDDQKVQRLHVWNSEIRGMWDGASELHTHPWDMTSAVMAGRLEQHRFVAFSEQVAGEPPTHLEQKILCGEGGGLCGAPQNVVLRQMSPELYREGDVYHQKWWEIHRSRCADGTVTVITRDFTADPDHAFVYWPVGEKWVSAEPRPATEDEILRITQRSLERWF